MSFDFLFITKMLTALFLLAIAFLLVAHIEPDGNNPTEIKTSVLKAVSSTTPDKQVVSHQ